MAVPPEVTMFCPTLKDFLSISISTSALVPVTTTASSSLESVANLIFPKSFSKAAIIFAIISGSGAWPGFIPPIGGIAKVIGAS